jgi:hypothetical protein
MSIISAGTPTPLQLAIRRLTAAMDAAGIDTSRLHIESGSKTYGRAFRLYNRDPKSGGLFSVIDAGGYLGMTKTEAAQSLDMIAQGVRLAMTR